MTETTKTLANGLRDVQRIITETDSSGKAVISKQLPTTSVWQKIDAFASFFLGYTTHSFPVLLTSASTDIASYSKDLSNPPGLTVSDGTVVRYVDMGPNGTSPMHKTMSVDYGVVLEGVIELVLDSGETRVMHRGKLPVGELFLHARTHCIGITVKLINV